MNGKQALIFIVLVIAAMHLPSMYRSMPQYSYYTYNLNYPHDGYISWYGRQLQVYDSYWRPDLLPDARWRVPMQRVMYSQDQHIQTFTPYPQPYVMNRMSYAMESYYGMGNSNNYQGY